MARYPRLFGSSAAMAQSRAAFVATGGVTPTPTPTPAPTPTSNLRVATNRGLMYTEQGTAATSATNLHVARARHYIGEAAMSQLVVSLSNFYCIAGNEPAGPAHVAAVDIEINGVCVVVNWGGQPKVDIASGASDLQSDPILPSAFGLTEFPVNQLMHLKLEREFAVGAVPIYQGRIAADSPVIPGSAYYRAASGSPSKIGTPGALTADGGYTALATIHATPVVLGVPKTNKATFAIVGASIEESQADGSGDGVSGAGGYVQRANGSQTPYRAMLSLACGGETAGNFASRAAKRKGFLKYCNAAVLGYGGNDFSDGRTSAATITDLGLCVDQIKAADISVIGMMRMVVKSNSTDGWTTTANQTTRTGFLDFRAAVDTWAASRTDVTHRIDAQAPLEDTPGIWIAPGGVSHTVEGTHPRPAGHALMAVPMRAALDAMAAAVPA
jgi:lysophospholipase L1-like esterase